MNTETKVRKWMALALPALLLLAGVGWLLRSMEERRNRIVGEWRVDGTAIDWYFAPDGRFVEDALLDTSGTYQVLSSGNIELTVPSGTAVYQASYAEGEIELRSIRGTSKDVRLLRKR